MARNNWLWVLPFVFAGSAPAYADTMRSVYTDTKSCAVTEEGEDAFIRECRGPGGVKAVLQYTDGLVGIFFPPAPHPLERKDMIEINTSAGQPYGAKLEWRMRAGDAKPCAAILRVHGLKGDRLVVNEPANGRRAGESPSNDGAEAIADRVCGQSASADPASAPNEISTKVIPAALSSGVESAKGKFPAIYQETGISGAIDAIETCYAAFNKAPTQEKLAECAGLDVTAANVDNAMMRNSPSLRQPFFSGTKPGQRIAQAKKQLGIAGVDSDLFDQLLMASLNAVSRPQAISSNTSPTPASVQPSVFKFPD